MKNKTLLARQLRQNMTYAETLLWERLRKKQCNGYKFLRQHPINYELKPFEKYFIADFYCAEKKLVIELDGDIHLQQVEYDQIRDKLLREKGIRTLRFRNEALKDMENVIKIISDALHSK